MENNVTRPFNETMNCGKCGELSTIETSFGRWIRAQKELPSSKYCVIDQDFWVHKFKTDIGREIQLIMFVEIKTHNSKMSPAQNDTMNVINKIFRGEYRLLSGFGKNVIIRAFGHHCLRFSKTGPDDSTGIYWDDKNINKIQLLDLLQFNIHPDDLNKLATPQEQINRDLAL